MLVSSITVFAVAYVAIMNSAGKVERQVVSADTGRAARALDQPVRLLERVAGDWAPWDETYLFLSGENPGYIEDNLSFETVDNLGVNFLAFFDSNRQSVHVTAFDLETGAPIDPVGLRALGDRYPCLFDAPDDCSSGLVELDGGIALVAAEPVLRSDLTGPPAGTLVTGRLLDEAVLAVVAEDTGLDIALVPHVETNEARRHEVASIIAASPRTITGSVPLFDITDTPLVNLTVSAPRIVHQGALEAFRVSASGLLGLMVLTVLVLIVTLDRTVLRRVTSLSGQVRRIRQTQVVESLKIPGTDELSGLADDVQDMVLALDVSRQSLLEAHTLLEQRVEERTSELRAAVLTLESEVRHRVAAEDALSESDRRHRMLVENLVDAVLVIDDEGRITYANPVACATLAPGRQAPTGDRLTDLLTPASAVEFKQRRSRGGGAITSFELHAHPGGEDVILEATLMPIPDVGHAQVILRDVTLRKRYEDDLVHMAGHDYLTGLFNRRRFEEELGRSVAAALRHNRSGAVLWLDLDGFKEINDSFGHRVGDEMLVKVAHTLQQTHRGESIVARLGGDEFAVLLPSTDAEGARAAAQRILGEIRKTGVETDGQCVRATASLGIVHFPRFGSSAEDLLGKADVAMYRAKESGRARWAEYEPGEDWQHEIEHRATWVQRIRHALESDGLVAFAQPIRDVETGDIALYELLVRMRDAEGTIIAPDQFLNAAERVGLVKDIDLWMARTAIRLLADSPDGTLDLNINVSPRSLADATFLETFAELVTSSGVRPARLGVEITETAIVNDMGRVTDAVRAIHATGCRLVLDDFGSGFSSFYYLKQMPLHCLKIDGSFVRYLSRSNEDRHLVRAMVEMARGLGMLTTAEYVQDEETLQVLRSLGVDHAQGYALGRPADAEEYLAARPTGYSSVGSHSPVQPGGS